MVVPRAAPPGGVTGVLGVLGGCVGVASSHFGGTKGGRIIVRAHQGHLIIFDFGLNRIRAWYAPRFQGGRCERAQTAASSFADDAALPYAILSYSLAQRVAL